MYHSWGSQNAWLRQIHGENPLYVPGPVWEAMGFEDGDWADVVSPHARITVPVARMDAQNPHTVWTWNAIGKRPGAWALDPDAPEATRGFLLNHLIPERLPPTRRPRRLQLRPGHRPGRLVRPPRPPRARPRPHPRAPRVPAAGLPGRPRPRRYPISLLANRHMSRSGAVTEPSACRPATSSRNLASKLR